MRHETLGRRGKSRIVAPGLVSRFPGGAFAPPAKAGSYTSTGRVRSGSAWRTHPGRPPHAAAEAAVAALVAHHERQHSGRGQHVDVSAQQAVTLATQTDILSAALGDTPLSRSAGGLSVGPSLSGTSAGDLFPSGYATRRRCPVRC